MALSTLLYFLLQLVIHASALFDTIDDSDPRVQYVPATILQEASCKDQPGNDACTGHWWVEQHRRDWNQTIHSTFGPDTIVTLEFQGSGITMFGATLDMGAIGLVTVDRVHSAHVNFTSANGQRNAGVQLYTLSGLDPSNNHTLTMQFDDSTFGPSNARRWLSIDYFEITVPDNDDARPASTDASPTVISTTGVLPTAIPGAASPGASTAVSGGSGSSLDGKLIGIIFGGAVGGVLVCAVIGFFVWRIISSRRPVAPSAAARAAAALPTTRPATAARTHAEAPARWHPAAPAPHRAAVAPYPFVGGSNSASSEAADVRRVSVTYPSSGASSPPPPPPRQLPSMGERQYSPRVTQKVFTVANPDAQASGEVR